MFIFAYMINNNYKFLNAAFAAIVLANVISCKPKLAVVSTIPTTNQTSVMEVDTEYYATVETPAMFNGGDIKTFDLFIKKNIKYPSTALKKKQQGTAYIQFGVSPFGTINYTYVLKSTGFKILDKEAIRVISSSPKWTPAQNATKYVGQLLVIPVEFKIKSNSSKLK